jgi:hypothetical protein
MSNLSCREVQDALAGHVGDAAAGEARDEIDRHLAACAACREAVALWTGIGARLRELAPEPLPPLVERRYAIRALGAPAAGASPRRVRWAVAGLATAFAAAVAAIALLPGREPPTAPGDAPRAAARPESAAEIAELLPDGRILLHLDPVTDVWLDPGTDAALDRLEADDVRIVLNEGRLVADIGPHPAPYRFVVATPSGEVEAKGTIFTVEVLLPAPEVARVLRGVVEVRPGRNRLFDPFLVFENQQGIIGASGPTPIPRADLRRDLALLLGPDAAELAGWLAAIAADDADDADANGSSRPDPSGRSARPLRDEAAATGSAPLAASAPEAALPKIAPAPAATRPAPSGGPAAAALVEQALAQREWGDFKAAAGTYRQLILEHDGTLESLSALVSLGQLELYNLGRANAASAHFESYLARAPSGALAEEARLGLVRAYDRSNRVSDVERAASEYLEHHATGYAAAEVCRARADARRLTGNCEGARADYVRIQSEWPSSREAATLAGIEGACAP